MDGRVDDMNLFQFHSGSIKTLDVEGQPAALVPVSIPLWFD